MKEIRLKEFHDLDEAVLYLESQLWDLSSDYEDIKGEISLIDGSWRVGIITDTRQVELFDGMSDF